MRLKQRKGLTYSEANYVLKVLRRGAGNVFNQTRAAITATRYITKKLHNSTRQPSTKDL